MQKTRKYQPEPGDQFVALGDLRPEHKRRIFEARGDDGTGYLGPLDDAEHHLLVGVVAIRFLGETKGLFGQPDEKILLKPEGYDVEAVRA